MLLKYNFDWRPLHVNGKTWQEDVADFIQAYNTQIIEDEVSPLYGCYLFKVDKDFDFSHPYIERLADE